MFFASTELVPFLQMPAISQFYNFLLLKRRSNRRIFKFFYRNGFPSFVAYIVVWVILLICNVVFLYNLYFKYVILQPIVYMALSNVWIVNLVLNILLETHFVLPVPLMLTTSMIILGFAYSPFVPSDWVEGYATTLVAKTFLVHLWAIFVLWLQKRHGSLFFLPRRFRTRVFDYFIRQLDFKAQQLCNEY